MAILSDDQLCFSKGARREEGNARIIGDHAHHARRYALKLMAYRVTDDQLPRAEAQVYSETKRHLASDFV